MLGENYVEIPREGITIALGYWSGDAARALRLARLLADIESSPRQDVTLALCRRADCPESDDLAATLFRCRQKFPTMAVAIQDPYVDAPTWEASTGKMVAAFVRPRTGHPDGANALWSGTVKLFAERWQRGEGRPSVFTIEHDGCPLSVDWIDRVQRAHELALAAGKRVTGCLMDRPGPGQHVNGTMALHLSMWFDRPSIQTTPMGQAFDVYHRVAFSSECKPSNVVKNIYNSREWSDPAIEAVAKETAWMASVKDDSCLEWAERSLVRR